MRILADENVPQGLILALRQQGFCVISVAEQTPGLEDEKVLVLARKNRAVLLTFDKDFGQLAVQSPGQAQWGVILCRARAADLEQISNRLAVLLQNQNAMQGCLVVLDQKRTRKRRINP